MRMVPRSRLRSCTLLLTDTCLMCRLPLIMQPQPWWHLPSCLEIPSIRVWKAPHDSRSCAWASGSAAVSEGARRGRVAE